MYVADIIRALVLQAKIYPLDDQRFVHALMAAIDTKIVTEQQIADALKGRADPSKISSWCRGKCPRLPDPEIRARIYEVILRRLDEMYQPSVPRIVSALNDYAGVHRYWEQHVHVRLLASEIRARGVVREGSYRQTPSSIYAHRVTSPEFVSGGFVAIMAVRYDPIGERAGEFEIMPWIGKTISSEGTCVKQDQLASPIDPAHFITYRPIDTVEGWRAVDWACFSVDAEPKFDLYIDITVAAHTADDAEFSLRLAYQQMTPSPCMPSFNPSRGIAALEGADPSKKNR